MFVFICTSVFKHSTHCSTEPLTKYRASTSTLLTKPMITITLSACAHTSVCVCKSAIVINARDKNRERNSERQRKRAKQRAINRVRMREMERERES